MAYNTLAANVGWLKNVDLKTSAANGVTQADLTAAEEAAAARIDAELAGCYDTSAWPDDTPPIIQHVAELLSSAEVLDIKYQRGDTVDGEDTNLPARLTARGEALITRLRGEGPALEVVSEDGTVQRRRPGAGRALPTGTVPETRFFPDQSDGTTPHNLKTTFDKGHP
jgi:hypothetical protein